MSRRLGVSIAIAVIIGIYFSLTAVGYLSIGFLAKPLQDLTHIRADVIAALINFLLLMLVAVMVHASLLTLAERKWSAMMQDRVGPNRARINAPFLRDQSLAGVPHFLADGLKMMTKERFTPTEAEPFFYRLAPVLNFFPVFCLFAIVPVAPPVLVNGVLVKLQVAAPDFGILYMFALASMAVYGTALAGWASNNKFALLGGVRATSQMIAYEVALGLSLVGVMIVCESLRLEDMVAIQARYLWGGTGSFDIGLPAWGIFLQPVGFLLFFTAGLAETKRTPFDLPEGESEVIGYFVEYSGMAFGLFMITEFVEIVVFSAVLTVVFLGGHHIGIGDLWMARSLTAWNGAWGPVLAACIGGTVFWVKVLLLCYVQLAIRWSFPRFRYDQIQTLGWQILLPLGIGNVFLTGALAMFDPSHRALGVVGLLELAYLLSMIPSPTADAAHDDHAAAAGHDHGHGHAAGDGHGHAPAAAHGHGH